MRKSGEFAEILDGEDRESRESFIRALYDAEAPIWEDIPYAAPAPHWPCDRFRQIYFESADRRRRLDRCV
jgi:hypothetical protein